MRITYEPEGEPAQEWDFDPQDIRASEAEIIEKRYGENFGPWTAGVQGANMRARRVLLWHLMRRQHHTLRYEDTPDFRAGELKVDYSVAELEEMRSNAAKVPDVAQREKILTQIEVAMSDALEREAAVEPPGKASSKSSAGDGGTSSPES